MVIMYVYAIFTSLTAPFLEIGDKMEERRCGEEEGREGRS